MAVSWERRHEALKAIHDAIRSGIAQAPEGKNVTKIEVAEDANGNLSTLKFYDDVELLFTLTFTGMGTANWTVTRS